jgi:signal transduction histidine kinase
VVENLVSNALRHRSPETAVTVGTRGEQESVSLTVHNWGNPITEATRAHLFEPLDRASSPEARKDGLGLGLYIVKSIVQAHGGTITVESTAAEGTTFTVRLPRSAASATEEGAARKG